MEDDKHILNKAQLLEQNDRLWEFYIEQQKELLKKDSSWLKFLTTNISVVIGILISFGRPESGASFYVRFCLVIGIVSLTLSLLFLIIGLYEEIFIIKQGLHNVAEEAPKAFEESRLVKNIVIKSNKIFKVLKSIGCILAIIAIILFCLYMLTFLK